VAIILSLTALLAIIGVIIATSPESTATITSLGADLGRDLPGFPADPSLLLRFRWAVAALISLFPAIIGARLPFSALIIFLGTLIFMVAYLLLRILNRNDAPDSNTEEVSIPSVLPFVLLLILTATLLVLGPEFVYLKDNFGQRLNTIFKFYYQAWVMFGVAALFGLDYLLRNFRFSGIVAEGAYVLALIASLLFPYYAVQSRAVEYRGSLASENRQPATLDGLAHLNRYNPDELAAINWLIDTVDGTPVILEAVGGQYTNYGRISASTGLPTVLGWAGHEAQWRGNTPEPGKRGLAVENIYDSQDWEQASTLLDEYEVTFIFLGSLEKSTYSPRAEEVFDRFLELAYENDSVKIYHWAPSS
jgi:uncharacterized membrane protein